MKSRNWDEIASYKFDADISGWFDLYLDVVFMDGSKGSQHFRFRNGKWSHAEYDQNKESAKNFFASSQAASIVDEVKAWCRGRIREVAKNSVKQTAADALSKGLSHDEIRDLLDEVLAESVMMA